VSVNYKKQYYPAFLKDFRNDPYDSEKLGGAFMLWKQKTQSATPEAVQALFQEFKIDAEHWDLHQRILNDEVLFRLLSEGYIHPKIHPVASFYQDAEFYAFVFPFLHMAVLKKMATAVQDGNLEAVKLLEQWTEPFGALFRESFYRMVEYTAESLLKELAEIRLQRKALPFDTYNRVNAALMHMLNRLPDRWQPLRDHMAAELMAFAAWLRNDMKVYTQPSGILTRLKLLNLRPDLHAQRSALVVQWESEKEAVSKEKFSVIHLLWIIPVVVLCLFFIWRQTDMGRSPEARMEDREEELAVEQARLDSLQRQRDAQMNDIDLTGVLAAELIRSAAANQRPETPADATTDGRHIDHGKPVYQEWLLVGRTVYFTDRTSLIIENESKCDAIIFFRSVKSPFMERAFFARAGKSLEIQDDKLKEYTIRVYAGSGWVDSLVTPQYDETLRAAGVPADVSMPSTTELRGRFLYPAKSVTDNLQPVSSDEVKSYYDSYGVPVIILQGDHNRIEYAKPY
jgi:hypothetical protein